MAKYDYKKLSKAKSLTEKELNALKNHINRTGNDGYLVDNVWDSGGINLTGTQFQKGKKYLTNLGFTPKGAERKNSPFGGRENEIVKKLTSIELIGFENTNFFSTFYVPVYEAYAKGIGSFQYYVSGGKIKIIG